MQVEQYEIMFRAEESHWWYRSLHKLIFRSLDEHLSGWKNKAILDAGCGTGAILQRLGNPAMHVGVDLSPEALEFCSRRGLTNVSRNDICDLPFPNESFDAVICSSVLYHEWVPEVDVAMKELRRVLRPGGLLVVNLPAHKCLASHHDSVVLTARRFTRVEGARLMQEHGFNILRNTGWTTLLFPAALVARKFSRTGQDFAAAGRSTWRNAFLQTVMDFEFLLLRHLSFPFGVGLLIVAKKS